MDRNAGWPSLVYWSFGFSLLAFAILGMMSIGIFVLPFAAIVLLLVARRHRGWPEAPLGAALGVAAALLFVAFGNLDYSPCLPEHRVMVLAPGQSFSCGGRDPKPWLFLGLLLAAIGIGGYAMWRRTHGSFRGAT
jgi:hypothetical protein